MKTSIATPPWERYGWFRRLHRWGVQHPKLYYITPPGVWFVWIYLTSVIDINRTPLDTFDFPGVDKMVHVFYFALFAILVIRGWQREKMPPLGLHGFVWLMSVVLGFWIEMQQRTTGYRSFEWADLAADAVGAAVGLVAWQFMMFRWGKRTKLYPGLLRPGAKAKGRETKKARS